MVHRLVTFALARHTSHRTGESGVVLVFVLVVMTALMGIAALVIDIGNAQQEKRQAQVAADAGALAAVQKIEDFGSDFDGSAGQWQAIVDEVKRYTHSNFGVSAPSWQGCSDPSALPHRPDTGAANTCISADLASWPGPTPGETALTNRVRVRLPARALATGFGRVLDEDTLLVTASAVAAVTRATTVAEIVDVEHVAGGPCALCVIGPSGTTLDGQNGDIDVTGGNVIVNSTSSPAASLHANGHITITASEGAIGGPLAPGNFSGSGYSPAPTRLDPVDDPFDLPTMNPPLPQCGTGSTCPTNTASAGPTTLSPGVYTTITGTHTLNPGIYVIKSGITLNGNDLLTGNGVMLYFACSSYPTPCSTSGVDGAGIKATGNGAMRITPPTSGIYQGMSIFADRNNTATFTYRGNGTNENGLTNGGAGTFYMKRGTFDLRGNGYTLASMIVAGFLTMEGNPSGVTIAYDLARNVPLTHTVEHTTTTSASSFDATGLVP